MGMLFMLITHIANDQHDLFVIGLYCKSCLNHYTSSVYYMLHPPSCKKLLYDSYFSLCQRVALHVVYGCLLIVCIYGD